MVSQKSREKAVAESVLEAIEDKGNASFHKVTLVAFIRKSIHSLFQSLF